MRIAVTGGLGFIGHKVVDDLNRQGHEVVVVDFWQRVITQYEKARLPIAESCYRILKDSVGIEDPSSFFNRIQNFDIVVHAGAVVDTKDLGEGLLWDHNVNYTDRLVRAIINDSPRAKIVFISSAATYGANGYPNNPYGLSKVLGEKIVSHPVLNSISLRLFNVFGDNEHHKGEMASVPFKLAQAYKRGDRFDLFAPDAKRDFVPVSAVVDAVATAIYMLTTTHGTGSHIVRDVGTGIATSFEDVDNFVMQACKATTRATKYVDIPPELVGRYQGYTCAGMYGTQKFQSRRNTRDGITDYYG